MNKILFLFILGLGLGLNNLVAQDTKLPFTQIQDVTAGFLGRSSGTGVIGVLDASTSKTFLSLNNVENTALSTWAGTSNITTLGTIGTGTWNATAIADGKIASALTGKTYNALTLTANATGFAIAGGTTSKTLTISNTLTFAGTDASTLNIGSGGTLGTAAFTNSTAYEVPLTFSTGLTRSTNTITVNASQNIATLSNLTSNGYVKTSGGTGTLGVSSTVATSDLSGTVAIANGGTNLSSLGTALQQLRVNAGATALEYFTPSASSGDISNGGNTTGAAITIGTNDAFGLNFETNNITRLAITGGASTGGAFTATDITANTNTVEEALTIRTNSSGSTAANFGSRLKFQLETTTPTTATDNRDAGGYGVIWTSAGDDTRTSANILYGVNNAGSIGEVVRFTSATAPSMSIASAMGTAGTTTYTNAGITPGVNYTIAGGSSNNIIFTSSSTGSNVFQFTNTGITGGNLLVGGTSSINPTSGFKSNAIFKNLFNPSSGSAAYADIEIQTEINQTGTASGVSRGLYFNLTLTNPVNYRAIDIPGNASTMWGIYQSGTATRNSFAGKTSFGTSASPTEVMEISGNAKVTGQYWSVRTALTDGATIAVDWNNSSIQTVTLGGNRTFTFANPKDGGRYTLIIKQDATGSRTVTWPTVKWAGGTTPTLTTTANKYDIFSFIYDGTNYYGTVSLNF